MAPWTDYLTSLNHLLADLYPEKQDSYRIVREASIPLSHIRFSDAAINNWYAIIEEALRRNKILDLIGVVRREFLENVDLVQIEKAAKGELPLVRGPVIGEDVPWTSQQPADQLEKIIGKQSTLLPISFLEKGLLRSRSIARIVRADRSMASGFLTKGEILVTNNHVFHDENETQGAAIQFNYQNNIDGLALSPDSYQPDPDQGFTTSEMDDFTLVRLSGHPSQIWGVIELSPVEVKAMDYVNIIQHPGGDRKQIALYHNMVSFADGKRIQYLTDTLPGSSGSPVFNSAWQVVGLHHTGGWLVEPGTKKTYYRNEGIHINVVYEGLLSCGFYSG